MATVEDENVNTNGEGNPPDVTDEEIAVIANKELRKKDKEIAQLKKEINQLKLLSTAEESEEPELSREDCIKILNDSHTCNYDYAKAVVALSKLETSEGRPNPLGEEGNEVCDFFEGIIKACDGDKSKFVSLYQANIGPDDPKVSAKSVGRKNKI